MSCLGACGPAGLASSLDLVLPAPRPHALNTGIVGRDYPDKPLVCALEDLGEVTVEPVGDGEDRRLARSMMATWHPEGEARCPGARVSYWITSSRHGRLGGLVFCAAGWHQQARDRFIGWSQGARDAHLAKVVNNDRFLVLPSVKVKCLAFDAITACRVMTIERLARSEPDTPASRIVHRDEITALNIYKTSKQRKQRAPPDSEPTIEAFAIDSARVTGFIPRKRQPLPGTEKLWQGNRILVNFVENYRMMRELDMLK